MYKIFSIILAIVLVPSLCFGGMDFDGTDDFATKTADIVSGASQFTISFWINPDTDTGLSPVKG